MAHNIQTFPAIERTKYMADMAAIKSAVNCQKMIGRPMPPLVPVVMPNLKFFRRLAGLRGGDVNG